MAKLLRLRRGTTTQHSTFTGAEGEVTVDTTKDTLVVHDNATAGGRPMLREDVSNLAAGAITSTHIADGTIVNADISASAGIAPSKITGTAITANDTGTVTSAMIADGTIVNADINASAAIAHTKLASITAGSVLMGNATAVPTATALTGDVTISSSGVTTISSGAVTSSKIADGTIVDADINAAAAIADTKLATISTAGKVSNSATTATNLNTANAIVTRNGSGDFNAGTITATLNGTATGLAGVPNITVGTVTSGNQTIGTSSSTNSFIQLNHNTSSSGNGEIQLNAWGQASVSLLSNFSGATWNGLPNGSFGFGTPHNRDINFLTNGTVRYTLKSDGMFLPGANNSYDLGSSSLRWRNLYTNDLNLSNEGSQNDVDGTWGSWTIQEGEDDLFLLNRRNGKKYKFNLQEVN